MEVRALRVLVLCCSRHLLLPARLAQQHRRHLVPTDGAGGKDIVQQAMKAEHGVLQMYQHV
jgi:hypothetical protein